MGFQHRFSSTYKKARMDHSILASSMPLAAFHFHHDAVRG